MEDSSSGAFIVLFIICAIFISPILYAWWQRRRAGHLRKGLDETQKRLENLKEKYKSVIDAEESARIILDETHERVRRLVLDGEEHVRVIEAEANRIQEEAKSAMSDVLSKADRVLSESKINAANILEDANRKAIEIAGSAFEAKEKADSYEAAIKAMKNSIDGYKDDYIIPNHAVLDDLADEFSHKEAGEKLKLARARMRRMVKEGEAGECDYAEANRRMYAIHFAVDAFNGKVDSAMAKVKHDNYGKIKQEILDAFSLVNHNGAPFRNARIRREYLDARLDELKWAVATNELRKKEIEEQKEIREKMREEERAQREMERAIREVEREERLLQQAMEKAKKEIEGASESQRLKYELELAALEEKLKEAEARGQRAISMAQQTRRGHVYIISNIGSFGENIYKIGMTRRLEPMDRVKELGDASVPFDFDVHAMIYSDDAPALERELHHVFNDLSVNKVNPRKEFFEIQISNIRAQVESSGYKDVHWTMKAEAAEYKESISARGKSQEAVVDLVAAE